jgi:putative ABC transport system permease protein
MGGGRARIIRQMLTESGVLATVGALLGLTLAWWGVRALTALQPGTLPRADSVAIDGQVLLFTAGATVVAALLFGAVPALKASSANLADALKDRGSESGGVKGNRMRTALVVSEVGLSLVLLIGAGLMIRSFAELSKVDPGFQAEDLLTVQVPLPVFKYGTSRDRAAFMNQLRTRLADLPGVEMLGGVTPLPLAGGDQYSVGSYGTESATDEEFSSNKADYKSVVPGYFEASGVKLMAGRTLLPSDNELDALPVGLVDEKLAQRLWPDRNPIGEQLVLDGYDEQTFTLIRQTVRVVGVVGNVRSENLAADGRETVYLPYRLFPWLPMTLTLQATANPLALVPAVRAEVEAMDPEVPVANARLMTSYVNEAMAQTRFTLVLIGVFAVMALVLAALGLYGVISYSVRQRTREIGVRMTFGAHQRDIIRLVLTQGMGVALTGIAAGLVAAFMLTRLVSSLLVGVTATDPVTFVGIPLVLLLVSLVATLVPARRATAVDPLEALRGE